MTRKEKRALADNLDAFVKSKGFDGESDFFEHMATVNLSTAENREAFQKWKTEDGTKKGLLAIHHDALIRRLASTSIVKIEEISPGVLCGRDATTDSWVFIRVDKQTLHIYTYSNSHNI